MTMPKFEPVAWRYELKAGEYTFAEKRYLNETYAPRPTAIHTADQLAEAYEAGKREASEDIEQAAFEKWLHDKCPSGDVESVQRQWLKSYEYAEFAGKLEQASAGILIESLCQQLGTMEDKYLVEKGMRRLASAEAESLRQQLSAALAACKLKDEALYTCEVGDYSTGCVVPPSFDERKVEEALAIQPDDIVEMDWRLK